MKLQLEIVQRKGDVEHKSTYDVVATADIVRIFATGLDFYSEVEIFRGDFQSALEIIHELLRKLALIEMDLLQHANSVSA